MQASHSLPRTAYVDDKWLSHEQRGLFSGSWCLVGTTGDFKNPGDYRLVEIGGYSLVAILCRHRGTTLFDDDNGNTGGAIVCPYHRWTYGLDGGLRGVPDKATCFPDLDRAGLGLKPAGLGVFREFVFVNADPTASFEDWIAPIRDRSWPHDLYASDVKEAVPLTYDLKCNWKVFVENAIDGYHLAYLHEKTLGGPAPDQNIWDRAGDHMIWFATEEGIRHRLPKKIRDENGSIGTISSAAQAGYGGVYYLFPLTLVVPTPYGLSVSSLRPRSSNRTRLEYRHWVGPWQSRDDRKHVPGYNKETDLVSSDNWTRHPLETGDFQTEDVWICEKVQRGLESPAYEPGPLSTGPGAEDPIRWFHASLGRRLGDTPD